MGVRTGHPAEPDGPGETWASSGPAEGLGMPTDTASRRSRTRLRSRARSASGSGPAGSSRVKASCLNWLSMRADAVSRVARTASNGEMVLRRAEGVGLRGRVVVMPQSVNQLSTSPDACCDQGAMGGFRARQSLREWLSGSPAGRAWRAGHCAARGQFPRNSITTVETSSRLEPSHR